MWNRVHTYPCNNEMMRVKRAARARVFDVLDALDIIANEIIMIFVLKHVCSYLIRVCDVI